MKIFFSLIILSAAAASSCAPDAHRTNKLTQAKDSLSWIPLFDEHNFNLVTLAGETPDSSHWLVEEDTLKTKVGERVDLRSKIRFRNFEMQFEFALTPGANSGIKYNIDPKLGNVGPEYQILDDTSHPDASRGRKYMTSSVYDLLEGKPEWSAAIGTFNQGKIIVQNSVVEHWLNGKLAVQFDINSREFKEALLTSKFRNRPKFGAHSPSYVLIQHHGEEVHFRHIKIRRL